MFNLFIIVYDPVFLKINLKIHNILLKILDIFRMDNQNSILKELAEKSPLDSTELAKKIGIPHNELYADLVSLNSI